MAKKDTAGASSRSTSRTVEHHKSHNVTTPKRDSLSQNRAAGEWSKGTLKFLACVFGIYFFYIWYSIIQERLTKSKYGVAKEAFPSVVFLVCVQCMQASLAALLGILFEKDKSTAVRQLTQVGVLGRCFVLAFSYVGAMVLSNQSLAYIDYPTQVLSKSCKPIPVLLLGLAINRVRYPWKKYLYVLLITVGIAAFMYNPKETKKERDAHVLGYLYIAGSLVLDGITGPFQEQIFSTTKISRNVVMALTNFFAGFILSVVLLTTGQISGVIDFFTRFPEVLWDVALFSVLSAVGQLFIYYTIQNYGALTCSVITTTRKFWTILASVIWFGHYLNVTQWAGVLLVFAGIMMDMWSSKNDKKSKSH